MNCFACVYFDTIAKAIKQEDNWYKVEKTYYCHQKKKNFAQNLISSSEDRDGCCDGEED